MKRIEIKQILLALCIICSNANGAGIGCETGLRAKYQSLALEILSKKQIESGLLRYIEHIISRYPNRKDAENFLADEIVKFLDLPENPENEAILNALTKMNDKLHKTDAGPKSIIQELQGIWKGKDWEHHKKAMGE